MKKISISLFLFVALVNTLFAQLQRANKYYADYDYVKAIALYKKVITKSEDTEALEKLANSYRLTKKYAEAEAIYARLMKQTSIAPINYFYYGMVLKNNNKIDEAKEQFKYYSNIAPSDKKAELSVKSCEEIKLWISKTPQFDVKPVPNVNSKHSDFCPVIFKNKLVFVSERTKDMVNYTYYSWNSQPYLNVYASNMKNMPDGNVKYAKKANPFYWRINSNYHDGPVCFNAEQNTMYLTRVEYVVNKKDENFINRPGLYTSVSKGRKWSKAKPFQYNNNAYTVAHPSISADGQWLFFASDMPGGQGAMDIYVCKKEGEGWGQPQNLGAEVNTAGNEEFPYIRKDGMLYFCSDGHPGLGGLDVFSAVKNENTFSNIKNLGAPLNSYTDDFGIVFSDDNSKGYFSSDRTSGLGNDDIYSFTAVTKFLTVSGKILLSRNVNDVAKNAKVILLTEDGKVLKIGTTDSTGFFRFDNLEPDKKYMVKLDETDAQLKNRKKYYLADDKDKIVRVTVINDKGGKFVFQNLPAESNSLTELPEEDITIAGNLLFGESPSKPLANTKVNLVNEKGEVIETTTTNAFGAFVFTNLPPDQNFIVRVDENDTPLALHTRIIITNKSGKEMQTTTAGNKGGFRFLFLSTDKNTLQLMTVEDVDLRFDFKGILLNEKKSAIPNTTVNIVNEKGEVIRTAETDDNGLFLFTNLLVNKNTLITLDENDPQIKKWNKIYLANDKGVIIKEFSRMNGKFRFTILANEQNKLGHLYVDDPWLKVLQFKNEVNKDSLITIIENVYYNYGEYTILPEAEKVLDKIINIMKNDQGLLIELYSHTDSRSTFDYNIKLSQQRAKAAVNYIVAGGIANNRLSGKGFGESKLINKCADGVECTEEEHAKNRRTEFKILRKR